MSFMLKFMSVSLLSSLFIISANAKLSLKERSESNKEMKKVTNIMERVKGSCGCLPKLEVDWESLRKTNEKSYWAFSQGGTCVSNFKSAVDQTCKEFKKELCAGVTAVLVKGGAKKRASLKGGKLTLVADGNECEGNVEIRKLIEDSL